MTEQNAATMPRSTREKPTFPARLSTRLSSVKVGAIVPH